MKSRFSYLLVFGASLVLFGGLLSSLAYGDSIGASTIALFPKDISELHSLDLAQAKQMPWFAQLKQQALPAEYLDFAQFLKQLGVDPDSKVSQIVWAVGSQRSQNAELVHTAEENLLGVAIGQFDPDSIEASFKSHNLDLSELRGYPVFTCGNGGGCGGLALIFLNSDTAVFGKPVMIDQLLAVRAGETESLLSNEQLFPLIDQANNGDLFWEVRAASGTRGIVDKLVPALSQFPQAAPLLKRITSSIFTIGGSSDLKAQLQVLSSSPDDIVILSQLLQAGLLLQEYQSKQDDPTLEKLLDEVRISANGTALSVSGEIAQDQITDLIQHNLFSKM